MKKYNNGEYKYREDEFLQLDTISNVRSRLMLSFLLLQEQIFFYFPNKMEWPLHR